MEITQYLKKLLHNLLLKMIHDHLKFSAQLYITNTRGYQTMGKHLFIAWAGLAYLKKQEIILNAAAIIFFEELQGLHYCYYLGCLCRAAHLFHHVTRGKLGSIGHPTISLLLRKHMRVGWFPREKMCHIKILPYHLFVTWINGYWMIVVEWKMTVMK